MTEASVTLWARFVLGPFWICVTLVFTVAISGNLSTFLSELGEPSYHYRPQFHKGRSSYWCSLANFGRARRWLVSLCPVFCPLEQCRLQQWSSSFTPGWFPSLCGLSWPGGRGLKGKWEATLSWRQCASTATPSLSTSQLLWVLLLSRSLLPWPPLLNTDQKQLSTELFSDSVDHSIWLAAVGADPCRHLDLRLSPGPHILARRPRWHQIGRCGNCHHHCGLAHAAGHRL